MQANIVRMQRNSREQGGDTPQVNTPPPQLFFFSDDHPAFHHHHLRTPHASQHSPNTPSVVVVDTRAPPTSTSIHMPTNIDARPPTPPRHRQQCVCPKCPQCSPNIVDADAHVPQRCRCPCALPNTVVHPQQSPQCHQCPCTSPDDNNAVQHPPTLLHVRQRCPMPKCRCMRPNTPNTITAHTHPPSMMTTTCTPPSLSPPTFP
ncbi:hypothetical protein BDN71DRAFT_1509155 [Pleurotus eryngii]|uniref:Uncharacterized protein n=1 Tax=Pleurotus eryngii TaxID=5323 RepID=A0A9P6DE59_PLEER|nr:hypothetical protein BDN71DRAFT_1509155 [Pleurotus eryngii]